MKIFMVSSYLPYPLFSGGHIRLYNLMKNLKRDGYQITLICEKRSYQTQHDVKSVEEVCDKVITFDRRKQWTIKNILKSGFSPKSFLTVGHRIMEMEETIKDELQSDKYDLIHIETFYVFQNVPQTNLPTVLAEHNIEYLVYKRYADKAPIFAKPLLNIDALKIKKEEKYYWKKATKLVAVSKEEKEIMKIDGVSIVANGVDIAKYDVKRKFRSKTEERKILFIGDFKWIQNRDSVEWIIKNIWPLVLDKSLEEKLKVKLWIVGKRIPKYLKDMGSESIHFDEDAPTETERIYGEADMLLAPIRVGGGTSYKILESMATGLPVLTTDLGNEGIDGISGKDLLVANQPSELANHIIELIKDPQMYRKISQNASDFIKKNFDWENISKELEKVYSQALKK